MVTIYLASPLLAASVSHPEQKKKSSEYFKRLIISWKTLSASVVSTCHFQKVIKFTCLFHPTNI